MSFISHIIVLRHVPPVGISASCMIPAEFRLVYYLDILATSTGDITLCSNLLRYTIPVHEFRDFLHRILIWLHDKHIQYHIGSSAINSFHLFLHKFQRRHCHCYCSYVLSYPPLELNCFIPSNYSPSYTMYTYHEYTLYITHPWSWISISIIADILSLPPPCLHVRAHM
jgi:hypothetical protein